MLPTAAQSFRRAALLALLLASLCVRPAAGQDAPAADAPDATAKPTQPKAPSLTKEIIDQRIKEVDASTSLDDSTKAQLKDLYQQAATALQQANESSTKFEQYSQWIKTAEADLAKVKEDLAGEVEGYDLSRAERKELDTLRSDLTNLERDLEAARKSLAELDGETQRRAARPAEIEAASGEAKEQVDDAEKKLAAEKQSADPPMIVQARTTLHQARKLAGEQKIKSLAQELAAYDAQSDLPRQQRDLMARRVTRLEQDVKELRALTDAMRREDAASQKEEAELALKQAPPYLRDVLQQTVDLAQQRLDLAKQIEQASHDRDRIEPELAELNENFERTQRRAEQDSSSTLGLLLIKNRSELPDLDPHEQAVRARSQTIRAAQLTIYELEDMRSALADVPTVVDGQWAVIRRNQPGAQETDTKRKLTEALNTQVHILNSLIDDTHRHFAILLRTNTSEEELISQAKAYRQFIEQRVFWVRSTSAFGRRDIQHGTEAADYLLSAATWRPVGEALTSDVWKVASLVAALLATAGLILLRPWLLRPKLIKLGEQSAKRTCRTMKPTLAALAITLLMALPWPVLCWLVSVLLSDSGDTFTLSMSHMLERAVWYVGLTSLFIRTATPGGLGEAHFLWDKAFLAAIRPNLRLFAYVGLPVVMVAALLRHQETYRYDATLGRVLFVVFMLILATAALRTFRGSRPPVDANDPTPGRTRRLRLLGYMALILMPVATAVLALTGYYFTAWHLASDLLRTFYMLMVLVAVGALLSRWVVVTRRGLAAEQAQHELEHSLEEPHRAEQAVIDELVGDDDKVDLRAVGGQTRQLIRSMLVFTGVIGTWLIWRDVMPALSLFGDVGLWSTASPSGTEQWVTVSDILLSIFLVCLTFVAARNLPGLLEIVVLQRFPLEASVRFAITTLSRYAIITISLLVVCNLIGLTWQSVQWLIAAIGVGLGFGLQEIVANFICGIILLFERPIRVGDIVTLDNTTGVVTRIQIRATTIRNWDRQELIIPNKNLITDCLINWSLSDKVNRIVIKLGIAYGSDTKRVRELLMEILGDHPAVLDDPKPLVTFEQFEIGHLAFVVRAYLAELSDRLETIHQLHTIIHERFGEEHIVFAMPQREMHVRSSDAPMPLAP